MVTPSNKKLPSATGKATFDGASRLLIFPCLCGMVIPVRPGVLTLRLPVCSSSASPSRRKNAMVLLEPPPYRVPQPSRPGQPAARIGPFQLSGPAPASTRKKVVATASRGEGARNRAGEPSEPFFRGTGQGLYAPDLRPWRFQARRRREGVAVPTPTDDNNAWERQGREDRAYPPLAHAPREPRRNEQGPGNLLPGPSGWSPRRRSYLSSHDCAAWSRRVGPQALPSAPCLQQLRLAPPATGGARLRCVASTLCWPAGIENTSFPKPQKESTLRVLSSVDPAATYLSMPSPAQYFRRIRA